MNICEVYAVVTLVITIAWTYYARNFSVNTLVWAMFFPGFFAPWFVDDPHFLWQVLGIGKVSSIIYCIIGAVFVVFILALTLGIGLLAGWGKIPDKSHGFSQESARDMLAAFLRAAGEEVGWRCYLLPCLLGYYSPFQALLFSGIVWALFHVPVMVLLVQRLRIAHPYRTVLNQTSSCLVYGFLLGWIAIKSGFSVWAPTTVHFLWNKLNPLFLGSIYTNQPGLLITGEQWLINGEGLAGILAGAPFVVLALWSLS